MLTYLFGSVLGLGRQVVEGVVSLSDSTEKHCDHTCNTPGRDRDTGREELEDQ